MFNYHIFIITVLFAMIGFLGIYLVRLRGVHIEKHEKVFEISNIIKIAAIKYLKTQLKILILVEVFIFMFLCKFLNIHVASSFLLGAFLSWISGFIAMYFSVIFNKKVALCSRKSYNSAFFCAFTVGSVISILINLLELGSCYILCLVSIRFFPEKLGNVFLGLSFGASLISVFARIGGGIFTKGADVGADLVGKVEKNLPEDDPRNPAVIADALGDNIGDANGMAADLFETYIVIVGAVISMFSAKFGITNLPLVFLILASGSLSSLIVLLFGWNFKKEDSLYSFNIGINTFFISTVTITSVIWLICKNVIISQYLSIAIGTLCAVLIMYLTEYYTSSKFYPVKSIVEVSEQGGASNIIQGLSIGYQAVFFNFILIICSLGCSFYIADIMGVLLTSLSLISISPVILALDAFGPITDNAGGLVEMAQISGATRDTTDELDAIGNMTKATTKGYSVFVAGFAAYILLLLFFSDYEALMHDVLYVDGNSLFLFLGLFVGGSIVALFVSYCLISVNQASIAIMAEVRRQFKELKILENENSPDYLKAIEILTISSLKAMILPALMPIVITVLYFILLLKLGNMAYVGLVGVMIGSTVIGMLVSTAMTVSGGAWDNAKKCIESSGNKGTDQHKAAVIGDTVGDPYKDTAGPALNPMIKVVGIVSIIILYFGRV